MNKKLHTIKKGARIWQRHSELVWICGFLLDDLKIGATRAHVQLDDESVVEISIKGPESLPFLRNPDILIGVDDLTTLSYLHEPAVLHNLQFRFMTRKCVYTYCGIVLVAINPYANCGHLYSDDVIQIYRGVGKQVRELDPHIYAVAEEAYYDLCEYQKNQSIIVSGESGAGKTVSAKHVMRYLATVAGGNQGFRGIEEKILASNPIMEAIGNAKTIRNDNSSRFGKFIQINFGDNNEIVGAEMKTYLLEKSRLVFQAQNERNYHIFYQMCASFDHALLRPWNLKSADDYFYANQGRNIYVDEVDDRAEFEETVQALDLLGFTVVEQSELFRVLAAVLTLGNVDFEGDEGSTILTKCGSDLKHLCQELLLVKETDLRRWLTHREIRAINETVVKPLTREESLRNRDALAKMLYSNLFNWVVAKVNVSLARKEKLKKRQNEKFIGVLDIYGFETFQVNSFEQFCINYANEKLQQQFNQHVFKLEQEEYEREELSWVRIDFYDNQPCIELIEGRPGLIEYLDEQCKIVKGTDPGWLDQITNCPQLKKQPHLQMPKIKASSFMVRHFAADVSYQIDGFVEKNKDSVNAQLLEVIAQTKSNFLKTIISSVIEEPASGRKPGTIKKTVAGQFRDSLRELMIVLQATRPHYVRCIKPNDEKEEFFFEPKRAIQQLRACGVLETVRISAEGYPSRWIYEDFAKRYRVLYPSGGALLRTHDGCKQFAQKACSKILEEEKFALGRTKIFFRTGQVALLERLRQETLTRSATKIQSIWRGYVARKRYEKLMAAVRLIQASLRAHLACRRLHYLQMQRAAVKIQTTWRRYIAEKRYKSLLNAVIAIQSAHRANVIRRAYQKMRYEKCAITIQRYFRGYMVRRERVKYIRKVIKVQCWVRRWLAKRRLREARIEARSVGHLQKLNKGLENKIIELQIKLDTSNHEVTKIRALENEKKLLEMKLTEQLKTKENEKQKLTAQLAENRQAMELLGADLTNLQSERPLLIKARDRMLELEMEVDRLQVELEVRESEKIEADSRCQVAESKLAQCRADYEQQLSHLRDQYSELKTRAEGAEKERDIVNSRLRAAADQLRHQELEAMNSKLRLEIDRLVESHLPNDYKARDMIDRLMEENEKLRDEATELRALLSNNPASTSPRPDSGHWSAGHSESGSDAESRHRLEATTDLDREFK
ncbi:unnamed protein product, partial [Mesorhabditis belari]|uniref:Myosin motor domain-containing protein n=1 Tax=Mesorhabditis belari TaxID=2138241 RepID=A0AAF3J9H7_9BILA